MMTYDSPLGVYIVGLIATSEINQSSWGESGKCFSPVYLPVWLVGA